MGLNSALHSGQIYVLDIIAIYSTTNKATTGITIKYHGTSIVVVNQFTLQEHKNSVEQIRVKESNTFFIISPPFSLL